MISAADNAQIMDALRSAEYPGVRCYLFTDAAAGSSGLDLATIDGRADGLLKRGWRLSRRHTRDGETQVTLDVALTRGRDSDTLKAVRAFAILARGAASGRRYLVQPNAVPLLTEPVMRFVASGRVEAYTLEAAAGDYLITSGGDTLVTSGGDSLVWS
jgi:hypothetical protein